MRVKILCFFLFGTASLMAQEHSPDYIRGLEAYEHARMEEYLIHIRQAYLNNREHDLIIFELMKALTVNGRIEEARNQLAHLIDRRSIIVHGLYGNKELRPLLTPDFEGRIREMESPRLNSDTAYVISERDLILEGIAIDHKSGRKFIGSTYKEKVVVITPQGQYRDFSHPEDSLWSVLGMEVDEARGLLWAAMAYSPHRRTSEHSGCSRLAKMDLHTGRLIETYQVCEELLNDLTVLTDGSVFVTGTMGAKLYRFDTSNNEFEPFLDLGKSGFRYLNGISTNPGTHQLYVAHETGVLIVDVQSREFSRLEKPSHMSLIGVDGLSYYQKSLICHQKMLNSVTRYILSEDGKSIIGEEIVDANHPAFDSPTTGELGLDGYYYYLANSQIRSAFDEHGKIRPTKELKDKIILRWKLPESH